MPFTDGPDQLGEFRTIRSIHPPEPWLPVAHQQMLSMTDDDSALELFEEILRE